MYVELVNNISAQCDHRDLFSEYINTNEDTIGEAVANHIHLNGGILDLKDVSKIRVNGKMLHTILSSVKGFIYYRPYCFEIYDWDTPDAKVGLTWSYTITLNPFFFDKSALSEKQVLAIRKCIAEYEDAFNH
jgi:hypothetical protein